MKLRLIAVIVFICGAFQIAGAEVLTLEQCVKIALENNYSVRSSRYAYSTSQAQLYNAWGDIFPTISISASAAHNWPGQFDPNLLKTRTNSYGGALNFFVTYNGLGIGTYANLRRASHAKRSSFYDLALNETAIVQLVKADYYNVVAAKSLVNVANDAVKRDQEGLRVAQSRYDLGAAPLSDVLNARVQLGNDQLDSVTQVNNYQLALSTLAFDMGIDVNREIEIVENFPMVEFNMNIEEAMNEALTNNPGYRQARFNYDVARDLHLQAASNLLPSLSFGLTHRTNVARFSDLLAFKGADASYTLSASLSFNIFNNFSDYANIKQAHNNVLTQSQNLYNTKNNVVLTVKQSFLNLAQANEAKRLSDESIASAQEALNIVREKYSLGAATILDLLTAEASLTLAQQNQVQAIYQYNIAVSQIEKVLGR